MARYDAVVVGAGPNGLSAAITLAEAGRSVLVLEAADTVGGGARSAALTRPGFIHDVCSAVYPLGATSPVFRGFRLDRHGLEWRHPVTPLAHPLDGNGAVVLERSIEATAAGLGPDGPRYRRLIAPLADAWPGLAAELLALPHLYWPSRPLVRFGWHALQPARRVACRTFRTDAGTTPPGPRLPTGCSVSQAPLPAACAGAATIPPCV